MTTFFSLLRPKRTWVQFRLRTLFVLVLVAAIPCGLFKWRIATKREAVADIERLGGKVSYDWQRAGMNEPPGAPWLRKLLGDDVLANVVCVKLPPRRILVGEYRLSSLAYEHGAKDGDLRLVAIFPNLERLDLPETEIGDTGLAYLRRLTSLRLLNLRHTKVSDDGLIHLKGLWRLEQLILRGTGVTKGGASELQKTLPN